MQPQSVEQILKNLNAANAPLIRPISITNAQLLDLAAHPYTLVPAPGSQQIIIPLFIAIFSRLVVAYTDGQVLDTDYEGQTGGLTEGIPKSTFNATSSVCLDFFDTTQVRTASQSVNKALMLINNTPDWTGGDPLNSITGFVVYYLMPTQF